MTDKYQLTSHPIQDGFCIKFNAMASPCEVLIATNQLSLAEKIGHIVAQEAWRIEQKYSRYNTQSVLSKINQQAGSTIALDTESYQLLAFADQCFNLSNGMFDISSGILRQAWHFDGSNNIPSQPQINKLLPHIGWQQCELTDHHLYLPKGMELDLGGLGKEYAVDRAIALVQQHTNIATLVNFGGDLACTGQLKHAPAWHIGVEAPGFEQQQMALIELNQGALATSGDAKRYLLKNNKRYSHILNPKTGWPIEFAPKSLTVAAPSCIQAGFLATLGLLQGAQAESFLTEQQIKHWSVR